VNLKRGSYPRFAFVAGTGAVYWPLHWLISHWQTSEDGTPPMNQPKVAQRHHPAVTAHLEKRAASLQVRVADAITKFAGSMLFVYIHAVGFTAWMLLIEKSPWPTLTLVVSLEAVFLSTFVMIGQNRQAAFQQIKADHDFVEQELELKTNTELTRAIHTMTQELHRRLVEAQGQQGEQDS
jgi:uncharacterized membrane protein